MLLAIFWIIVVLCIVAYAAKPKLGQQPKLHTVQAPEFLPQEVKTLTVDNRLYVWMDSPWPGYYDNELGLFFFQDRAEGRYWYKVTEDNRALLHRMSGAAVEFKDGLKQYYLQGNHYTLTYYNKLVDESNGKPAFGDSFDQ